MRKDIVEFVRQACQKYGMEALYFPENDVYSVRYKGRAISNFNTDQFYQYPRAQRMREYGIHLHHSLNHNLGESYASQLFLRRRDGIRIA